MRARPRWIPDATLINSTMEYQMLTQNIFTGKARAHAYAKTEYVRIVKKKENVRVIYVQGSVAANLQLHYFVADG
jgi:hypothetical protein